MWLVICGREKEGRVVVREKHKGIVGESRRRTIPCGSTFFKGKKPSFLQRVLIGKTKKKNRNKYQLFRFFFLFFERD